MIDNSFNLEAIILCGGKGERLRPLTEQIPKPMVVIKKKPILYYIINHLKNNKINKFKIATGYKSEVVNDYLNKNHSNLNIKKIYSGDVDIIKRIQDACKYIKNDFLILYGDTISNVNISDLQKFNKVRDQKSTITVWPMQSQFGLVDFDKKLRVISFKEKPILDKYMNIGYFYFRRELINKINRYKSWEIFLNDLVSERSINAFKHNGIHITVNTIDELKEAEKNIGKII